MFYVIEKEFVGHADFGTGYDKLVNGHYFVVTDEQGRKNLSGEPVSGSRTEPVWLGTSGDWSSYARGDYLTEEAAVSAAICLANAVGHGFRFFAEGEPEAQGDIARAYVGDEAWSNIVDAGEWLADLSYEELGINPGMTDLEIEGLAEDLEAISLDADECRLWGTESFIRERIKELKDDLEELEDED